MLKFLSFLHCFLVFYTNSLQTKEYQNLILEKPSVPYSKALTTLSQNFTVNFDVNVQVDVENKEIFEDIMDELNAFLLNITFKAYELNVNSIGTAGSPRQLTFLHKYEDFLKIYDYLKAQDRRHYVRHVFCLFEKSEVKRSEMMGKMMQKLLEVNIVKVNFFLRERNGTVSIYRMAAYAADHCGIASAILLNHFIDGRPEQEVKTPQQCRNLRGCALNIYAANVPPYLSYSKDPTHEELTKYFGLEGEMLKIIGKLLNFSVHTVLPDKTTWGDVYNKSNMSGPFKLLHNGSIDIYFGGAVYTRERLKIFDASDTYFISDQVVIMRKRCFSNEYANWLFDPLEKTTWICIEVSLIILSIFALLMQPSGKRSQSLLRLWAILLGTPVSIDTKSTFKLLILFTLKAAFIVLRSVYVGKIFDSYNKEHCETPPATISDLILRNYTILANVDYTDALTNRTIKKMVHQKTRHGMFRYWDNLQKPEQAAALLNYGIFINYMISGNHFRKYMTIPQPASKQQLCIYFRKHSCLVEPFNAIIGKLITSGITAKWKAQYNLDNSWRLKFRRLMSATPEPVPMTLEKMRFVFYSFIVGQILAILAFLLEINWRVCKRALTTKWLKKRF